MSGGGGDGSWPRGLRGFVQWVPKKMRGLSSENASHEERSPFVAFFAFLAFRENGA